MEYWKNLDIKNLDGEIWKGITGLEKSYQASNLSRIKSISRKGISKTGYTYNVKETILSQSYKNRRYYTVSLVGNNKKVKSYDVHRLVALSFCDGFETNKVVNHIDGDKSNNNSNNLEWCTHQENIRHALNNGLIDTKRLGVKNHKRARKLTDKQVLEIKYSPRGTKTKYLSLKYNVTMGTIRNILDGTSWSELK